MMSAARNPVARLSTVAPGRCQLEGDVGFDTVPALWRQVDDLLAAQSEGRVDVDLSGVAYGDSAGLALLVAWQSKAMSAGVTLRYSAVPERLVAIARISSVDSLLVA
ncbi:MAG: hypothetical protein RLZZ200_1267 [Pseudomonadota bacterium]|jgi:anti-anti-sigma factor